MIGGGWLLVTAALWLLVGAVGRSVWERAGRIRADEEAVRQAGVALGRVDAAVDRLTERRRAGDAGEVEVRMLLADRAALLRQAVPMFDDGARRTHGRQVRMMGAVGVLLGLSVLLRVAAGVYGPVEVAVVGLSGFAGALLSGRFLNAVWGLVERIRR